MCRSGNPFRRIGPHKSFVLFSSFAQSRSFTKSSAVVKSTSEKMRTPHFLAHKAVDGTDSGKLPHFVFMETGPHGFREKPISFGTHRASPGKNESDLHSTMLLTILIHPTGLPIKRGTGQNLYDAVREKMLAEVSLNWPETRVILWLPILTSPELLSHLRSWS